MKFFLRSIILFGVTNFGSLASAQTTWTGSGNNSTFEDPTNWSAGLPSNTVGAIVASSVTINQNSAQSALTFAFQSGGTINLNLSSSSILTVVGEIPNALANDL